MFSQIHAPQNRLSKDAVKVWIISEVISSSIIFSLLTVVFYLDHLFLWKEWVGWILIGITVLSIFSTVWSIFFRPFLLYKIWRYDVDEDFLQLKSGAFTVRHELVPMTKIQSVETNHGPLLRKYGLRTLSITTMGSTHVIPALPKDVAIELRDQVAHFAKVNEVG
ncbi:PH domain-containing protein [Bacillus spongiae]|uniref:PH domain-containing protein n=1 Tax=Bacillus spongiae TaxID=2683610 RepID=A0ABU8HHJ4_9BACI